jgi:hypothetical protein
MIWLDRVLAVPTVGFSWKPELYTEHDAFTNLRSLFDKWSKEGEVHIKQAEFTFTFETKSGFNFTVGIDKAVVEFQYRFEPKERPGLLPVFPQLDPKNYSELLESTVHQAGDFVDQALGNRRRTLIRVGIVASTRIDGESPPPGVDLYVKHLQSPWRAPLIRCEANLTSLLHEDQKTRDQCHHRLNFNQADDDKKNDFRFVLDWQRVMLTPVDLKSGTSRQHLQSSASSALDYFEKFGKGDLDYAVVTD